MSDLPDYTRLIAVNVNVPSLSMIRAMLVMENSVLVWGDDTTTANYEIITSFTPSSEFVFHLTKLVIHSTQDAWVILTWADIQVGIPRFIKANEMYVEYFVTGWYPMSGGAGDNFDVKAKYATAAGTITVEASGFEVLKDF